MPAPSATKYTLLLPSTLFESISLDGMTRYSPHPPFPLVFAPFPFVLPKLNPKSHKIALSFRSSFKARCAVRDIENKSGSGRKEQLRNVNRPAHKEQLGNVNSPSGEQSSHFVPVYLSCTGGVANVCVLSCVSWCVWGVQMASVAERFGMSVQRLIDLNTDLASVTDDTFIIDGQEKVNLSLSTLACP